MLQLWKFCDLTIPLPESAIIIVTILGMRIFKVDAIVSIL